MVERSKVSRNLQEPYLTYWKINNVTRFKLLSQPCADCNITWHPLVMTFDHRDRSSKFKSPSCLLTYDPKIYNNEVSKCDVVCRNCHQIREYLRDLGVMDIGEYKIDSYNYYKKLIPYLCGGAIIRKDASKKVKIKFR